MSTRGIVDVHPLPKRSFGIRRFDSGRVYHRIDERGEREPLASFEHAHTSERAARGLPAPAAVAVLVAGPTPARLRLRVGVPHVTDNKTMERELQRIRWRQGLLATREGLDALLALCRSVKFKEQRVGPTAD